MRERGSVMAAGGKLLDSADGTATEVKRWSHHHWCEEEVVLQGTVVQSVQAYMLKLSSM